MTVCALKFPGPNENLEALVFFFLFQDVWFDLMTSCRCSEKKAPPRTLPPLVARQAAFGSFGVSNLVMASTVMVVPRNHRTSYNQIPWCLYLKIHLTDLGMRSLTSYASGFQVMIRVSKLYTLVVGRMVSAESALLLAKIMVNSKRQIWKNLWQNLWCWILCHFHHQTIL